MARNPRRPTPLNPLDELTELAVDLDLTALAAILSELLQRAEHESLSYTDFALALLRTEVNARKNRRLERSLKRSRLGSVEGLEGFNFAIRPQLEPRVVKELLNARFAEEKRNVLCLGNPGLGKTRVAKAIAHAACLAGYSTLYVLTVDMLEDLDASRADRSFDRALRRYVKPQVLLLDEFGHAGPFDSVASHYLFRVVGARHQKGSIVITANTGFSKWKSLFPSEETAVATVDRLVDRATILRFTGKSLRDPLVISGAPLDE
jgi:DNA replication protein DnaC